MRTALSLLVALSLSVTALAVLPDASAVGTCTKLANSLKDPDCPYLFCYGTRWSYPNRYVECYECFDPFRPECDWPVRLP